MKREIYTFDKKDYEQHETVKLNFNIALSNIESVKQLLPFGKFNVKENSVNYIGIERKTKIVEIVAQARHMYELLCELGHHNHSDVWDNISVYQYKLDKSRPRKVEGRFIKYKPGFGWSLIDNTPIVINGVQKSIHGCIYRRNIISA